jgi:hypothetical protein
VDVCLEDDLLAPPFQERGESWDDAKVCNVSNAVGEVPQVTATRHCVDLLLMNFSRKRIWLMRDRVDSSMVSA